MGISREDGHAGHFPISVGFAGLHNKGCGVFDAPHRGVTATAFIPGGLPDLAERLSILTTLHFVQRLLQAHVFEAFEQAHHQWVSDGG